MNNVWTSIVTVLTAIIGIAVIAVLVSQRAQTVGVIGAAGQAFSGALGTALSPVTGGSTTTAFAGTGFTGPGPGYAPIYG